MCTISTTTGPLVAQWLVHLLHKLASRAKGRWFTQARVFLPPKHFSNLPFQHLILSGQVRN